MRRPFGFILPVVSLCFVVAATVARADAPCPPSMDGSVGPLCGRSAGVIPLEGSYFVDPSATGANNGHTPADAWRNLASVPVLPDGSNLYLKSDGVFEDQRLRIRWSGTANDPAVVTSYCMNGSQPTTLGCGTRAEVNGTFDVHCRSNRSCSVDTAASVPSSRWDGLVEVDGDYVEVSNLLVADSAGQGVKTGSNDHNIIFENLEVAYPAASAIRAGQGAHHLLIRGNYVHHVGLCHAWFSECPDWPAAILLTVAGGHSSVAEYNDIYSAYGEGIGMYSVRAPTAGGRSIVRGNRIGDVRSTSIYAAGTSYNVIEDNVMWQPPRPTYDATWEGIGLNAEDDIDTYDSIGHIVRNNVIFNRAACFRIGIGPKNAAAGIKIGGKIYGNTCINPYEDGVNISYNVRQYGSLSQDFEFRDNIVYGPHVSGHLCYSAPDSGLWSHNQWSQPLSGAGVYCHGDGDVIGKPRLAVDVDTWTFPTFNSGPTPEYFRAISGAAAGTPLTSLVLSVADYSLWTSLSTPRPARAEWERQDVIDIEGNPRALDNPTIGASEQSDR